MKRNLQEEINNFKKLVGIINEQIDYMSLNGFKELVRRFAMDNLHDEREGNYSDAHDLMNSIENQESIEDIVGYMNYFGISKSQFFDFLNNYVKDTVDSEEWESLRSKLISAYKNG